jgi:hypothetical protein
MLKKARMSFSEGLSSEVEKLRHEEDMQDNNEPRKAAGANL